jgi:glycerol-3-phosphate dehydrogenase
MVLVHGLGGASLNWLGVGPALARRARVLALDLPGFGRTPLAGRSASVPAQREVLGRFLASVVAAPAIVVGNSMGGLIAMMEAAAEPARVAALVLAAPAQPPPAGGRIDLEVLAAFGAYAVPWLGEWYVRRRAARLGPEGLVREMFRLCCVDSSRVAPEVTAAHVALATERLQHMPWATPAFLDAARSTLACIRRPRAFYEMAGRITAPVLLIQGAGDRLVPPAASRALARRRPDWILEILDDLGHVPQLEDPKRFVDTLERWLDRTPLVQRACRPL